MTTAASLDDVSTARPGTAPVDAAEHAELVRELRAQMRFLSATLRHQPDGPDERHDVLVQTHRQLRAMARQVNAALAAYAPASTSVERS